MRKSLSLALIWSAALLSVACLTGCGYVCHYYSMGWPAAQPMAWRLYGDLGRMRGPSNPHPARYSWPHWPAAADDSYELSLTPVPQDTMRWRVISAELAEPTIVVGGEELRLRWSSIEDVRMAEPHWLPGGQLVHADSLPSVIFKAIKQPRRAHGPRSFRSEEFHLPSPPPDSLEIRVELRVCDPNTGEVIQRVPLRTWAIIDRHVRWGVIDAAES